MNPANQIRKKLHTLLLLLLTVLTVLSLSAGALAQGREKIVRVGWFESPFNTSDEFGRRSGYAYDYQQKIAAYSGWTYEYVEGSWSELLQMLSEGKIDLLGDVSYTDERAERMLFSSLPMGAEDYYLFAAPGNTELTSEDFSTFNGKKIGANKGSVQITLFRDWAKANGVRAELVELTGSEKDNITLLNRGDIDLYLSLDGFFDKKEAVPVCRIGSSDFFFAVSKSRPELLVELNNAMNRVLDENQFYNQLLSSKYLQTSSVNLYLSSDEKAWLADHGPLRVGYQDNYLAFCAQAPQTGELTGALKDYLSVASDCMENAQLDFQPVCYPSSAAAMEALKNGEVDCVFPANLTSYDGESSGVFVTPALMRTDMSAVVRKADERDFAKKDRVSVAVNADNPNYDMFLLDHFPDWRPIYFDDTPECLKAVADGQADCLLISHYRYNNISGLCEKYDLTTWSTGVEMDYCFAVRREDTVLYSILAKTTGAVPESTVNAALSHYFTEDAEMIRSGLIRENLRIGLGALFAGGLLAALVVLLFSVWRRKREAKRQERILSAEDFRLMDDLPVSYSVYRVTHAEHSELYDAEIIYVNHKYEQLGGLPAEAVLGHRVRQLYPFLGEEWFRNVKRAALDGETVESDHVDVLTRKRYRITVRQISMPGYCAITYLETEQTGD